MSESPPDDCQIIEEKTPRSISCSNIPDAFLDKIVAKKHFSQFGRITNFTLRPSKGECLVEYETSDEAENALLEAGIYNGDIFEITYSVKQIPRPKMLDEMMDPDVQYELEGMSTATAKRMTASSGPRFAAFEPAPSRPKPDLRPMKLSKPIAIIENMSTPVASTNFTSTLITNISTADKATKNELEAILRRAAISSEEKYAVLDARDKLIRLTTARTVDITRAVSTKGSCPDMCPEKERLMREAKHQVASFEERSRNVINHIKAVKQYSRSSADQETPLPHELRPEPVLQLTMNYLLHKIMDLCDDPDTSISDWFHFVWDRTRSIRKDITQQELCSPGSVLLVEQCARFHIHCAARLIAEAPQVFDQRINTENLTKCLQTLKYMYHDLRLKHIRCAREAEFRAYVILLNLHDSNFLWEVKQLPGDILHSDEVQFALKVYLTMETNNYVKFFSLVRATTYMNSCILLRYFTQVRVKALTIIIKVYRRPAAMSISYLQYVLAFEDFDQCALFLEYYGLNCVRDDDKVIFDSSAFYYPDLPFILDRAINVVEHKRHITVGEVVHGDKLDPPDDFLQHKPQDSFDENGYLLDQFWMTDDQKTPGRRQQVRPKPTQGQSKEETLFKIPTTFPPRQSSPKSNEFLSKLATKPADSAKTNMAGSMFSSNNSSFGSPAFNNAFKTDGGQQFGSQSDDSNIFKSKFGNDASKDGGFSLAGTFQGDNKSTPDNSVRRDPFGAVDVTDSKNNLFKTVASPNNFFQLPTNNNSPSGTVTGGMFSSGFSSLSQNQPVSGLFSQAINNASNLFQEGQSTGGFGDFRAQTSQTNNDVPKTSFFGNRDESQGTGNLFNAAPRMDMFSGSQAFSQIPSSVSSFAGFKSPIHPVIGASALAQNDDERASLKEKERLEEQKRRKEEERMKAETRRLEEESERHRIESDKQKALVEKKQRIDLISTKLSSDILEDLLNDEFIIEIAGTEIAQYKNLEKQVDDHYNSLLNEVVTHQLTEITEDIVSEINQNAMKKYFRIWRKAARDQVENRRKIETTPIWMPSKSMPELLPELRHPMQSTTLKFMKRYRLGVSRKLIIPAIKQDSINVWKVAVPEVIKTVAKHQRQLVAKSQIYWKCVISVPDAAEDDNSEGINRWLNNLFVRQSPQRDDTAFFVEQNVMRDLNCQQVSVCMRKLVGPELINEKGERNCNADTQGTNAVLFFMSAGNIALARERLETVLSSTGVKDAVGIIMYNLGTNDPIDVRNALDPYDLLDIDTISKCFFSDRTPNKLCQLTEIGMQFIAANSQFDYRLEMQRTTSFLKLCLGDEFWERIISTIHQNPTLSRAIQKVDFVANIYNEALRRLSQICSHSTESNMDFSAELRRFVPDNHLDIPLDLEHFPPDWNITHEQQQQQLVTFLKSLEIKCSEITDLAEATDISILEKKIIKFTKSHIEVEKEAIHAGYKLYQQILLYLNENEGDTSSFQQKMAAYTWLRPLQIFSIDVLTFRYHQYSSENRLPSEIIYDRGELRTYTGTPWWLTLKGKLLKEITSDVLNESRSSYGEDEGSPTVKRRRLEEATSTLSNSFMGQKLDIDDILAKGKASVEKADRKIATFNAISKIGKEVSKGFDYMLYKQEQAMRVMKNVWEQHLKK